MLTDDQIQLFTDSPVARDLYYLQSLQDDRRASDMIRFLNEIQLRGYLARISVEVDSQVMSLDLSFSVPGSPGADIHEYLRQFCAAMNFKNRAVRHAMRKHWPELGLQYPEAPRKGGRQNGPEGA